MWGTSDALWGCEKRGAVRLRELRSAGSLGSSVATDPQDCRRGAGGAVAGVREAVRQAGAAPGLRRGRLDCSRETTSRPAVAGVLFGALGAAVEGATRLQSAVPVVCWTVAGRGGVGRHGVHQES